MALWTPAQIDTALWLDAADESTITLDGSDNVAQWDDKSGNDRHFEQTSASFRPSIDDFNNKDSIDFSSGNYLTIVNAGKDLISDVSGWSFFAVVSNDGGDSERTLLQVDTQNTGLLLSAFRLQSSDWIIRGRLISSDSNLTATYSGNVTTGVVSAIHDYSDGTVVMGVSGDYQTGSSNWHQGTTITNDSDGVYVGALPGSRRLVGRIAEVIIIRSAVNNETRDIIDGYLAHKWGLEDELPAEHPYKQSAPATTVFTISGIITDKDGNPTQRKVYAMSRPTDGSAPALLAHTLSDETTGEYELILPSDDEVTRIVVSEDDDDPLLNDIIDRVIPQ